MRNLSLYRLRYSPAICSTLHSTNTGCIQINLFAEKKCYDCRQLCPVKLASRSSKQRQTSPIGSIQQNNPLWSIIKRLMVQDTHNISENNCKVNLQKLFHTRLIVLGFAPGRRGIWHESHDPHSCKIILGSGLELTQQISLSV